MSEALLTAAQVADLLNLNVETVYALVRRDGLPAVKIGGQWRFQRTRIEQWLDQQHEATSGQVDTRRESSPEKPALSL